jgi:hypothetical protein
LYVAVEVPDLDVRRATLQEPLEIVIPVGGNLALSPFGGRSVACLTVEYTRQAVSPVSTKTVTPT